MVQGPLGGNPDEVVGHVASALSTTSVTYGGDELRTGWYSDEASLAPSTVGAGTFGAIFSTSVSGKVFAQPLVSQGTLFVVTENNVIYGLDALTGKPIWSRTLASPFTAADANCSNIAPNIGITGTPVIDSATNGGTPVTSS